MREVTEAAEVTPSTRQPPDVGCIYLSRTERETDDHVWENVLICAAKRGAMWQTRRRLSVHASERFSNGNVQLQGHCGVS